MKPGDNTAHNKGDAADAAKTPFDQSENQADIKITADLRKAILGMEGMSTNADNVKIMTANGVVAVRGVVESQSEIDAITKLVKETPGVTSSDIQLTVDPD
jgi:osmotically-inducible protein OsmY